jgi:hypothetical protein
MHTTYSNPNNHHYAIDAAKLVERCRSLLYSILNYLEAHSSARAFRRRAVQLVSLCDGELRSINESTSLAKCR